MNQEFSEAVEDWLAWLLHNAGRSSATASKYRLALVRFGAWYAAPPADAKLAPLGSDPLRPSLEDLEKFAGMYAHSLKMSARARRPLVSALRGFFAWLSAQPGRAPGNPAAVLPQPLAGFRLPRAASLHDAERLLLAPDVSTFMGLRDAAIFALFAGSALRVSGLVGLNESALRWYRDDAGLERLVIRTLEKGNRERLVPIANEAAMLLRAYLGHDELATIPRLLPNGDAVLFVSTNNRRLLASDYHGAARRLSRRAVVDLFHKYAKQAGVPMDVAHPHALRHLYGAELAEDDVRVLTAQTLLGHADPKSTGIYSHLAERKLRAVVDKSNPLAKMRGPLLDSLRQLHRATKTATPSPSGPHAARNANSGGLADA